MIACICKIMLRKILMPNVFDFPEVSRILKSKIFLSIFTVKKIQFQQVKKQKRL